MEITETCGAGRGDDRVPSHDRIVRDFLAALVHSCHGFPTRGCAYLHKDLADYRQARVGNPCYGGGEIQIPFSRMNSFTVDVAYVGPVPRPHFDLRPVQIQRQPVVRVWLASCADRSSRCRPGSRGSIASSPRDAVPARRRCNPCANARPRQYQRPHAPAPTGARRCREQSRASARPAGG